MSPLANAEVGGGPRVVGWPGRALAAPFRIATRLLTSVKFGVFLLIVFALGAIAGTFIESYIGEPNGTPTAQRLVYHSWWYIAVMVLLAVTLNAASFPNYLRTWRLPRFRTLKRSPTHFESLPVVREIAGPVTVEQMRAAFERSIGRRVVQEQNALFAQRGLIQRWGFIITHAGMTLMLAGSVYLSVFAHFAGPPGVDSLWVGEGIARDWIYTPVADNPDMLQAEPLPFTLRLHDFDADFFPGTNVPRFFGSYVELITPEGERSFHQITMNEALRWHGWKFSQNSYSVLDDSLDAQQSRQFARMDGEGFARLQRVGRMAIRLVDTATGREYPAFDVSAGTRVRVPDSDLDFETPDGSVFHVIRGEQVLAHGTLSGAAAAAAGNEGASRWAIRIDGIYPDFRMANDAPSTASAVMSNPAIGYTLLEGGNEVGSDTAFLAPQFRGMRFSEMPIRAVFRSHEPADIAEWHEGDPLRVSVMLVGADGTSLEAVRLGVGETHSLYSAGASAIPPPPPKTGAGASGGGYQATVVGRQPGAYSVLGVMRESNALKMFFYLSFFLFGLGPYIAFTSRHWQVWAWVDPQGRRTLVGGRAWGRRATLPAMLDQLKADLEAGPREVRP